MTYTPVPLPAHLPERLTITLWDFSWNVRTGPATPPTTTQARRPRRSWVFHPVMAPVTLLWVLPLVFVILVSVRSFDDMASNGLGTWVFNDLLWALTVLRIDLIIPITAALLNLQGGYTTSWNVVAAGALIAAVPTTIVFFAFQRHFVSGLLVGANK